MIQIGVDFSINGVAEAGLTPIITIRDTSDGSVVINAVAVPEVGGGAYKYNFTTNDISKKYRAIIDGGSDTLDSRYMTAWSERAKSEAEIADILSNQVIRSVIITDLAPSKTVFETDLTEIANDFWNRGVIKCTSGQNEGVIRKIQNYDGATKITLKTALPYTPLTNDTLDIIPLRCFRVNYTDITEMRQEMDSNSIRLDATVSSRSSHNVADVKTELEAAGTKLTEVKSQTDKLTFTGVDIKATLDGEEVITDAASRSASKATGFATENPPSQNLSDYKDKMSETEFHSGLDTYSNKDNWKGGGMSSVEHHASLDSYANKDAWKAVLAGLATEVNATSNKNAVIVEIDQNEAKLDAVIAAVGALNNLSIANVQTALNNQGYTVLRAALLDNLDAAVSGLNNLSISDVQTALTGQGYTSGRAFLLDNLDAAISSVLLAIGALNNISEVGVQSAMDMQGYTALRASLLDHLDMNISTIPSAVDVVLSAIHGAGNWQSADTSLLALEASLQLVKTESDKIPSIITALTFVEDIEAGDMKREGVQLVHNKPSGGVEVARFNLFKTDGTPAGEGDEDVIRRERV